MNIVSDLSVLQNDVEISPYPVISHTDCDVRS